MSLAADTREAVRNRPVLYDALCAGIVNYTAAAESLAVDGDTDAIATALRRFGQTLAAESDASGDDDTNDGITVRMRSGLHRVAAESLVVAVDGRGFAPENSPSAGNDPASESKPEADREPSPDTHQQRLTAIEARGSVSPTALSTALARLRIAEVGVIGAAGDEQTLVFVVPQRAGVTALRCVESALNADR